MIPTMHRLVLLCGLVTGCRPTGPGSVAVRAYAAPSANANGGLVLFFHPWSIEAGGRLVGRAGAEVLEPLADITVSCARLKCETRPSSSGVSVWASPAPRLGEQLSIEVARAGYEPATVEVIVGKASQTVLVMLKRSTQQGSR
jgi:hypothetical protein